ncbi:protein FAM151B-like isoform X1 [Myxocyprinus asiaticus]|uniref:protein FAM151B-like isoform X1 n=1 Tax=Myxocyprinus asiaticus TaxID=70543 RepID=UPI00222370CD|nr:protein FAM151B-like isoform X1 [Myxocyprinus asiaticus]
MGIIKHKLYRSVLCAAVIASLVVCYLKLQSLSNSTAVGSMSEHTLEYFFNKATIQSKDAADIVWYHAANSKSKLTEALRGSAQMIEADVLLRGLDPKEPIMAHPPENDSDISLQDWLKEVVKSDKGIKLDFKSLEAVSPSMILLEEVRDHLQGPMWINADILPGPGGKAPPLDPQAFLQEVSLSSENDVLSLGWTTGWDADVDNPGYSWEMVHQMEELCRSLMQPVTFPVRAALLPVSFPQLQWLLEQSDRYSLTVWTGKNDVLKVEDLLPYRQNCSKTRIYYDLLESQMTQFRGLPGYS